MGRNPELSVRKPEATSLTRMTAFNTHNIGQFFDKLTTALTDVASDQILFAIMMRQA